MNLTLKFENVATKLPPKLQLEICDPDSGQVVYMKRQNIYYIKLQEKLATLDCDKNYVLKVTSIKDNITADEEVVIQKKDAERSQGKEEYVEMLYLLIRRGFFQTKLQWIFSCYAYAAGALGTTSLIHDF